MAEPNQEFSKRLILALQQAGMTRKEVADRVGIRRVSMTKYTKHGGVPEWEILVNIARLLNVSTDWLLTGQERENQTRAAPLPGEVVIRLPRGDTQPLNEQQADLLEKALVVLRASGDAEHFAGSLENNIESFYRGVQNARQLQPGPSRADSAEKNQKTG